ncbi:MAG: hypothetical protein SH850_28045 [Planctomycetaceae bacterium]|nr:hypothetical protein [Planctomycetaceae bacterium]
MPDICIICGSKAQHRDEFKFTKVSFLARFVFGILAYLDADRKTLRLPFCDKHKKWGTIEKRVLLMALGASAAMLLGILLVRTIPPVAALLIFIGFCALPGCLLVAATVRPLSARKITRNSITIAGAGEDFADAIERERHVQRDREAESFLAGFQG